MYPFADGPTWVRDAWYVVAFAGEVGDAPVGRTALGDPLVLYRTGDGAVVCLAGACPHRQYPLDRAVREGDDLRCPYHGMRFAPDGHCVEIPSQSHVPERCRVRAYPVVEQWQWVWVWMGDPARADPAAVPDRASTTRCTSSPRTACRWRGATSCSTRTSSTSATSRTSTTAAGRPRTGRPRW